MACEGNQHPRLAHDQRVAEAKRGRHLHLGEIAQQYRRVVAHRDDGRAEGRNVGRGSRGFDQNALGGEINEAGAPQRQRRARRIGQLGNGDVVAREPAHVRKNLNLPQIAAENDDVRDSRHGEQPGLDHPVRGVAQRIGVDSVGQQADLEQIHGAGHQGRQFRRADARGQRAAEFRQPLGYTLARHVHIDTAGKRDGHDRQPGDGFGTQGREPRRATYGILDRPGDQFLDLLRCEAVGLGLYVDLGGDKFRKHVQRRVQCAPCPQQEREQRQRGHRPMVPHAKCDQCAHHG